VAPCRSCVNRRFGGMYHLHLQVVAHAGSSLAEFSTLKMEAICSSETSVHTRSTRRLIPEDAFFTAIAVKTSNLTQCSLIVFSNIVHIMFALSLKCFVDRTDIYVYDSRVTSVQFLMHFLSYHEHFPNIS
jgi:hypothetical protein